MDDRLDDNDLAAAVRLSTGIFEATRSLETIVRELERRKEARRA